MDKPVLINSYEEFVKSYGAINEDLVNVLDLDTTILDKLVDTVGSEEDIEQCAKEAFEELEKSVKDGNGIEFKDEDTPKKLAISALLVKLVEKGKLDPQAADDFLEAHL